METLTRSDVSYLYVVRYAIANTPYKGFKFQISTNLLYLLKTTNKYLSKDVYQQRQHH